MSKLNFLIISDTIIGKTTEHEDLSKTFSFVKEVPVESSSVEEASNIAISQNDESPLHTENQIQEVPMAEEIFLTAKTHRTVTKHHVIVPVQPQVEKRATRLYKRQRAVDLIPTKSPTATNIELIESCRAMTDALQEKGLVCLSSFVENLILDKLDRSDPITGPICEKIKIALELALNHFDD